MLRVQNVVFWVAAAPFVASLFLSDPAAGLFGERGSCVVTAALLVVIVVCRGAITSHESGRNPIADTERGERTNRQLFFALVFTIGFFPGEYFIAVAVF